MKKILTMVLAMMFVAGPVLAAVPPPAEEGGPLTLESLEAAAASVVAEDAVLDGRPAATPAAAAQEDGTNTGKVILGIALIAGGAGFIANGASLWQSDEDVFGRKKNLDSYSLYALGGATAFVGALVLRSGLRGEGW